MQRKEVQFAVKNHQEVSTINPSTMQSLYAFIYRLWELGPEAQPGALGYRIAAIVQTLRLLRYPPHWSGMIYTAQKGNRRNGLASQRRRQEEKVPLSPEGNGIR